MMVACWVLLAFCGWTPDTVADRQQAVEWARDALGRSWNSFPWYDPAKDDLRPVREPQPYRWEVDSPRLHLAGLGELLAWVLLAAILAGLVYGLVRALGRLDGRRRQKAKRPKPTGSDDALRRIEALPAPSPDDPEGWLASIRRYAAAGQYRQAIVLLFSYMLVQLDKQQQIHLDRGKTNRQYLRELGMASPLYGPLEQTMVAFEDVYFGDHALDPARFELCYAFVEQFV